MENKGNRTPGDGAAQRVLVVDDESAATDLVSSSLRKLGFDPVVAMNASDALRLVNAESFDLVTTDLRMPGMDGLELLGRLHEDDPTLPVIMLSAYGDFATVVDAMRAGAFDWLQKPFQLRDLDTAVRRALERTGRMRDGTRVRSVGTPPDRVGELLGESETMRETRCMLYRVAPSDSPVLVTGESGTGKALAAAVLHRESTRQGSFLSINCAALPHSLLEAELFGSERGAFPDAAGARTGHVAEASGGTLFLDEIAELPAPLQAKLMVALQERAARPLGSVDEQPDGARLVVATSEDLESAVAERRFRKDLFFRINVIELVLPPLRDRGDDIELLARHFLAQFAARMRKNVTGMTDAVRRKLFEYEWPGNVRELQNTIERAVALARGEQLGLEDLPPRITQGNGTREAAAPMMTLEDFERRHILAVLEQCGGSRSAAAKVLGLDRSTLWRKLERFRVGGR